MNRLDALAAPFEQSEPLMRLVNDLLDKSNATDTAREETAEANDGLLSARIAELKIDRAEADRRMEAAISGLNDLLQKLYDRLIMIESQTATAESDSRHSGPATSAAKTLSSAPTEIERQSSSGATHLASVIQPPGPFQSILIGEKGASLSLPEFDDVPLEPGVGAPQRMQRSGSKTNPALTAHIAAARRATQAAVAESGVNAPSNMSVSARGVARAKSFYAGHKRSVMLAVALAIAASVAVRLVGPHSPLSQKQDTDGQPPKESPAAPEAPKADNGPSSSTTTLPPAIDPAPTASIRPPERPAKGKASGPSATDVLPAIPLGLTQPLQDGVLAGAPAAQYELALRLYEGRGLPQDQKGAALWFERAAIAGFAPAQFRLGALYQKGIGVARDLGTAKQWYLKAAEAGNTRAAHNLAVMEAEPEGEKPDYADAAKWFRIAGELGVRDSQFNLGVLYARGLGVEQDLRQSWLWFSLAAAQGDIEAARKRDEVAAKMDATALAAAADGLTKFKVGKPDPLANEATAPSGGWDGKANGSPSGQTMFAPQGGTRVHTTL